MPAPAIAAEWWPRPAAGGAGGGGAALRPQPLTTAAAVTNAKFQCPNLWSLTPRSIPRAGKTDIKMLWSPGPLPGSDK